MTQGNTGPAAQRGRLHHLAAGGGVRAGQRIGATDEIGLMAVERPLQFRDLHATIFTALGLAHEDLSFEVNGRQERLTGVAGSAKPIAGVLARYGFKLP